MRIRTRLLMLLAGLLWREPRILRAAFGMRKAPL